MKGWIFNASPLILLGKIDQLEAAGANLSEAVIAHALKLADETA